MGVYTLERLRRAVTVAGENLKYARISLQHARTREETTELMENLKERKRDLENAQSALDAYLEQD